MGVYDQFAAWLRRAFPRKKPCGAPGFRTKLDYDTEEGDLRIHVSKADEPPDSGVTCWTSNAHMTQEDMEFLHKTINRKLG